MKISVFLLLPLAPSSLIDYYWEESGFWFWLPLNRYFHVFMRFFLNLLLFGLSNVDPSVASVMNDVPVSKSSLWFLVGLVPVWPCLFYWRDQNWTKNSDGVSPVVRGRITPTHLRSTLLLSDHRALLSFFITRVPRLLMFSLLPIKKTRAFPELSNWLAPAGPCASGYSSVGAELCACLC